MTRIRRRQRLAAAGLAIALTACALPTHRVMMQASRLPVDPPANAPRCTFQLGKITDARPAGDAAGGLGRHQFTFDDPVSLIKRELLQAGLAAEPAPGRPRVDLRLLRLYLTQNLDTKVPVVVYEVTAAGAAPFLVRSQQITLNWNGSENEAYTAYARALHDADGKLLAALDTLCPA